MSQPFSTQTKYIGSFYSRYGASLYYFFTITGLPSVHWMGKLLIEVFIFKYCVTRGTGTSRGTRYSWWTSWILNRDQDMDPNEYIIAERGTSYSRHYLPLHIQIKWWSRILGHATDHGVSVCYSQTPSYFPPPPSLDYVMNLYVSREIFSNKLPTSFSVKDKKRISIWNILPCLYRIRCFFSEFHLRTYDYFWYKYNIMIVSNSRMIHGSWYNSGNIRN